MGSGKASVAVGFDFTGHARRLAADMIERLPELSHVDLSRVAISFSQTRKPVSHGIWATLTPMRFEGGSPTCRRRGRTYAVQRLLDPSGREMLYILTFYLPRFLDQSLEEKLSTVLHELWHISPEFDGDLRRFPGRCYAHGGSQHRYDEEMHRLMRRWLSCNPPEELIHPLRSTFSQLRRQHGGVYGARIPAPKLIAVPKESADGLR